MPTSESISRLFFRAVSRVAPSTWRRVTSSSWLPMVNTGLSEVIGSWKIMAISRPRMDAISATGSLARSSTSSCVRNARFMTGCPFLSSSGSMTGCPSALRTGLPSLPSRGRRAGSTPAGSRTVERKRMLPLTTCPIGACTSCMRDRLVTDLPQPDSPTTPTVAPCGMSKDTPLTALTTPLSVKK